MVGQDHGDSGGEVREDYAPLPGSATAQGLDAATIAAAIDDWGERQAVQLEGKPVASELQSAAASLSGATVGRRGGLDAAHLVLTSEVISTCARYRTAAQRVARALETATGWLETDLRRIEQDGAWSFAGLLRIARTRQRLEAHEARADRVLRCTSGQVGVPVFRCGACNGEEQGVPMGCNARICPRCAPKLRAANEAKVLELLQAVDVVRQRSGRRPARWRFLTLTIRSQPSFAPMRRALARAWSKLLRRRFWQRSVTACVAFFETTHTKAGWHVHLHALVDGYVHRPLLVTHWQQVTDGEGQAVGVHLSEPKGSRQQIAHELAKYLAKDLAGAAADEDRGSWGVAGNPDRLAEFYLGSLRWRALRTYGDAFDALQYLEGPEAAMLCEDCGRPMSYDRTRWVHAGDLVLRSALRHVESRAPP